MKATIALAALSTALLLSAGAPSSHAGPLVQVVELSGYRARFDDGTPAFVRYMLIDPGNVTQATDGFAPLERRAVLMLFTGGDGRLNLVPGQINTGNVNFLVRTRYLFAAESYVVAVVDAASDFLANNGLGGHRLPSEPNGDKHLQDLNAVMSDLRARFPGVPVWAVGTSAGTLSAAVAAASAAPAADGLVLSSSLTGPNPEDLSGVALESVAAPVLIVSHRDDQCPATKPADSAQLRKRFTASPRAHFEQFHGGSAPLSGPCDALAAHGFFGIEQKVIEAITRWVAHNRRR